MVNRDIKLLYPELEFRLSRGLHICENLGIPVALFEGWRSPERQSQLFRQKPPVTKADAWMSWHQYGLAFDIAVYEDKKWSWDTNIIMKAREVFQHKLGLEIIGDWDAGHYQLTGGLKITQAYNINQLNGTLAVWEEVGRRLAESKH